MALVLRGVVFGNQPKQSRGKFSWSEWYEKNKARLAEKKKKRYLEDEAYRNSIKERSKTQRKRADVPQDEFTLSMQEVSDQLGVTIWTLREWRKKNYFPEPVHRLGRLWLSPTQVQWLERLKDFLVAKGLRLRDADRKELDELVSLIYSNWN
jgi:hypothetical protein